MAAEQRNLGEILVAEGVLSQEELEEALEKSRIRNLSLEETLFKLGYITRDKLGNLLARAYNCDFIDLHSRAVSDDALRALPAEKALKLHALPYALEGETLTVAVAAPLEGHSLTEIVADIERTTGKKVRASFCNPEFLKELLLRHYKGMEPVPADSPAQDEFAFIIKSIKSEEPGGLRAQIEELNDIGQTALIAARSHPFSRAVASAIEEARVKLADAKKYAESGFDEEALEMARRAITMLNEASDKADGVERDWEKLVQQVKSLRGRINVLEEDGAAEYAPADFKRLAEIRDELMRCVTDRNVDKLRFLMEQAAVIAEKVGLQAPDRNRGREQVITSLAKVREVIARARKAGAKDHAQDVIKQAYEFLDKAETHARHAQWDEVRECLTSAESKALEAERIALAAEEEKKRLTVRLREAVRIAIAEMEAAMARRYAREVIDDLMRVRDAINEAKACFDTCEFEKGIGLAETAAATIKNEIIIRAEEAEHAWSELFQRADAVSARIRSVDMSIALRVAADKVETLFQSERGMIAALCEGNREKLADSVSVCENMVAEILGIVVTARDGLQQAEAAIAAAGDLLIVAKSGGVDERVAPAFREAENLMKDAQDFLARGDIDTAVARAGAARAKLQSEVIESQEFERQQWLALVSRSTDLLRRVDEALSSDAMRYCPELVRSLRLGTSEILETMVARNPEKLSACVDSAEGKMAVLASEINAAKAERYRDVNQQLAEIEKAVETAVQRCSGNYSPDMLESAYLDLSRLKQQIAGGPDSLDAIVEGNLARDLAVARTKVWQVEFLRERFEAEQRENLNHLREKMESAREAVDACVRLDFVGDDSPSVAAARSLLEQAENLLIEGDIDRSFEIVRQCHAAAEKISLEAGERERRWNSLVRSSASEDSAHVRILADSVAAKIAGEECKALSEMVSRTGSIIDSRNLDALAKHAEQLERLAQAVADKGKTRREESLRRIEERTREVNEEIRLALTLKAEVACPDVMNAAQAYLGIARSYASTDEFDRADAALSDARTKARDAGTLARAAMERSSILALDYMRIASAHVAQQRPEAAKEALERGIALAELARISSRKE
ncbi:hypothetical protein HZA56_00005 [Candidatus Poribacteria bacterium]|nr:hypothetical protein [Candidatus Poribacteria bacterium]